MKKDRKGEEKRRKRKEKNKRKRANMIENTNNVRRK